MKSGPSPVDRQTKGRIFVELTEEAQKVGQIVLDNKSSVPTKGDSADIFREWLKELFNLAAKREYAEVDKHPERGNIVPLLSWDNLKKRNWMANGVGSVQMIWAVKEIEKALDVKLYPTMLFEYQHGDDLLSYLVSEYKQEIEIWAEKRRSH